MSKQLKSGVGILKKAALAERLSGFSSGNSLVLTFNRAFSICFAAAVLSSCALIKAPEAPRDTFDITAPSSSFANRYRNSRSQVLVKVPTALKSIDSERMIVRPSPSVITYLGGAQWGDTVPRLVQAKLVEALENSGATGATAKPGDGLVIDYQLVSDIRKFEILQGVATIEMSVKLLTDSSGLVRETKIFRGKSKAFGSDPDDYVAAFDRAFGSVASELVIWVAKRT